MPYRIERLRESDIKKLTELQPPDWNDIRVVFRQFFAKDYFYPVKLVFKNKMVAAGEVLLTKETGWLGCIVVHPLYLRQGFGEAVTRHLMDFIRSSGRKTQLLLATEMGKPLYSKLGFRVLGNYLFLKHPDNPSQASANPNIRPFLAKDFGKMIKIDAKATGEFRQQLLEDFLEDAVVAEGLETQKITGFYLPHLGDGFIAAKDPVAGKALMEYRLGHKDLITLPDENKVAIEYALSRDFHVYREASFMVYGPEIARNHKMIYNRIGGYLG